MPKMTRKSAKHLVVSKFYCTFAAKISNMGKLAFLLCFILSVYPADVNENKRHIHVVRRGSKKSHRGNTVAKIWIEENGEKKIEVAWAELPMPFPFVTDEADMLANTYQSLAARTINSNLSSYETMMHALHGLAGEVGEIHSIFQKKYQGHVVDKGHLIKEMGDLLWFIAELCTAIGCDMESVMETNIKKLKERYPEGFDEEKSLHRKEVRSSSVWKSLRRSASPATSPRG